MFEKNCYLKWGDGRPVIKTINGLQAVDDAIKWLKRANPVRPLQWSCLLARAAKQHVEDIGARGSCSHVGGDGRGPKERMNMHGNI